MTTPAVVIPLYIYPSPGAWDPLFDVAASNPNLHFIAIVNPHNGPGTTPLPDANYVSALTRLSAIPNVQTLGYVHSSYGARHNDEVKADIRTYAYWDEASAGRFRIDGIFIDETPSDRASSAKMGDLARFIRKSFAPPGPLPSVYMPSTLTPHADHVQSQTHSKEPLQPMDWLAPPVSPTSSVPVPDQTPPTSWWGRIKKSKKPPASCRSTPASTSSASASRPTGSAQELQSSRTQSSGTRRVSNDMDIGGYHPASSHLNNNNHTRRPSLSASRPKSGVVVYNPGTIVDPLYFRDADHIVVFEQSEAHWMDTFLATTVSQIPRSVRPKSIAMVHSLAQKGDSSLGLSRSTAALTDQIRRLGFGGIYLTDQIDGGYTQFPSQWEQALAELASPRAGRCQ